MVSAAYGCCDMKYLSTLYAHYFLTTATFPSLSLDISFSCQFFFFAYHKASFPSLFFFLLFTHSVHILIKQKKTWMSLKGIKSFFFEESQQEESFAETKIVKMSPSCNIMWQCKILISQKKRRELKNIFHAKTKF
jgi:hypothetical protein